MVGGRRYLRRAGSRGGGRDGTGDAIRPTAVLYRVPEAGRVVRWLGSGLPIVAQQSECPAQARSAWHGAAVCSGGHRRYAHITALGCDPVNPPLLGMRKVLSEDAVRRNLGKIDEEPGLSWLQGHL